MFVSKKAIKGSFVSEKAIISIVYGVSLLCRGGTLQKFGPTQSFMPPVLS